MTSSQSEQNSTGEPLRLLDYTTLRSWYLARLRQSIVRQMESGQLTPAALIQADRMAVEKIVVDVMRSKPHFELRIAAGGVSLVHFKWLLIAIPITIQIATIMLVLRSNSIGGINSTWILLIPSILCAILFAVLFDKAVARPLHSLQKQLAQKCNVNPISTNHDNMAQLVNAFSVLANDLSQAVEREHAIADYALELICAMDRCGRLAAVSPSFAESCGYAIHELIAHDFIDFVKSDDSERTNSFLKAMQASQSAVPFENRLKRKDGSFMDVLWLCEWSRTEDMLFCVGRDISDQKRLERVKQEFVSMVGHDLRSPLTSLDCTLELLSGNGYGELSEKGQSLLSGARESISSLIGLINDLLDLERMEAGKLNMRKEQTALSSILKSCSDVVSSYAKQQEVQIFVEETDVVATVDRDRLAQVVINLLSNAIKFSPQGGKISVTVARERAVAVVSVTDEGPGIPPKFHDIIFDRFQQAHTNADRQHSGLGLSICKAIIEAHEGSIGVTSEPGMGSTFWFKVPIQTT